MISVLTVLRGLEFIPLHVHLFGMDHVIMWINYLDHGFVWTTAGEGCGLCGMQPARIAARTVCGFR
jgi:hypothetical protein